ncbi:DUF1918 domain-containing protein, partial [Streptomyces californicus]|uniref:DUF1918 domain-containing protein n=1 Tax=Streptomyces californicus TaxID=67351 RepID=UPI003674D5B0
MEARKGDRLLTHGRTVGQHDRVAEIRVLRGGGGGAPDPGGGVDRPVFAVSPRPASRGRGRRAGGGGGRGGGRG